MKPDHRQDNISFSPRLTWPTCSDEPQPNAQQMEAISTLAGGMAHEFNNILAAMMGFTELTQDLMPEGSTAWNNLQEVLTAGRRATELIQCILAFSRPLPTAPQPIPYASLVTEALSLLGPTLPSTIEMRQTIAWDVGYVLADRTRIRQLIHNLCSNAIRAMQDTGGVLEVSVDTTPVDDAFAGQLPPLQPGPHMRLTVRDTGQGMSPEILVRIFEPFFTTQEVGKGTGMGLAIVHGIVLSLQGAITVQSTPGEGSEFVVYLPQISRADSETFDGEQISGGDNHP
ncbi:MAG: ATP-binding protein [Candidatus Tectomicrobia bacterium]|nr:ATP-binding protein [Candidatus Tectomicrobia bacterium]